MEEEWRDIKDFKGFYMVSNIGRVKSIDRILNDGRYIKGKILKCKIDKDGYCNICLKMNGYNKWKRVHRLVAEAFIPNPNNFPIINHKNSCPFDNCINNLEWCDNSYNQWYRCHVNNKPPNNDYKKKRVKAIYEDNSIKEFNSVTECANYFNVSRTAIERKLKGKSSNPSLSKKKNSIKLYGIKFEYIII